MPLSDEAVAVRVAELVDGVVRQLLSVWDKLEPVALGEGAVGGAAGLEIGMMTAAASSLSLPPSSIQMLSPDANSGAVIGRERKRERARQIFELNCCGGGGGGGTGYCCVMSTTVRERRTSENPLG